MKIFVYGQRVKTKDLDFITTAINEIKAHQIECFVAKSYDDQLPEYLKFEKNCVLKESEDLDKVNPDFVLTLGGDGTILSAVTFLQRRAIPILGINLGRLGFLAMVEKTLIKDALDKLILGDYHVEERSMLELKSNIPIFKEYPYALNDLTLHKRDTSSMIKINSWIDGKFLKTYWADGIILATPTGSTGYSLSCGGPIIFPKANTFVITAVAPHNLNSRPLIIPDSSEIKLTLEGRSDSFLCTLDSRYQAISSEHELVIRKAPNTTKVVQLKGDDFMKTLHDKMMWGVDNRN